MQKRAEKASGSPDAALRRLPAVERLLGSRALAGACRAHGRSLVATLVREELERLRGEIRRAALSGSALTTALAERAIAARVDEAAQRLLAPRPRPVINASGVVVHTNLGRSVLSESAAAAVAAAASGYLDLEYDLAAGGRGSRLDHLAPLMERLFPGQGFLVVNNNAAALVLTLRALARGRPVLVSRGELVEIGGSFRIPDIMAASGARLVEVGTTNRTRAADYERALTPRTALVLRVHTSNFQIVGFTEETPLEALAAIAARAGIPLVVDQGSGDLVDLEPLGIRDELPAAEVLRRGADLVTFSGDKLLGGPQAGFIVGKPDLVRRLRRDPLARVCRLDRLLVAALQRTLAAYVRGREFEEVPTLRMLALAPEAIGRRAERLRKSLVRGANGIARLAVIDGVSRTGGGSSPLGERPTRLLAVELLSGDAAPLERRLRGGEPPVIGRLQDGKLLLDLRTVLESQDETLGQRLAEALAGMAAAAPTQGRSQPEPKPRRRRLTR